MDVGSLRRSLVGAAIGGGLFGAVSVYRSWVAPGTLLDYLGPVGLMVAIGATVGGLVGPMIGEIAERRSRRRDADAPAKAADGSGSRAARPPVWVVLLAGAAVGTGAGVAWDRPVIGIVLGIGLALLFRRIFR